jgi:hypothetical protein
LYLYPSKFCPSLCILPDPLLPTPAQTSFSYFLLLPLPHPITSLVFLTTTTKVFPVNSWLTQLLQLDTKLCKIYA